MKKSARTFRNLLILLLGLILAPSVYSQTFQENLLYGDEAMDEKDYYGAAMFYRNALYLDSTSLRAAWNYAEASRQFNNYVESEKFYASVLERDKGVRFELCRFWLAISQKANGKYQQAGENFKQFMLENPTVDDYYLNKSTVEREACALALDIINNPLNISIEHLLDPKVNTAYSEFNAIQLGDTSLMFSALRPLVMEEAETIIDNSYMSSIYIGTLSQSGFSKVKKFDSKINVSGFHNANVTISEDQTRMYFSRVEAENNPQMKSELWYAENTLGKWQKPVRLNDSINVEPYTSTQPALSESREYSVLYFVSNRPGGFGKLDIWYVVIKDGKYGEPVNLGSNINTPGDEITPYYHDATSTLYFSSDWHKGLGGYDIFKSKGALNQWAAPKNVGYPLNTSYNDIYFTVNTVDNDGYLTSNRPGSLFIKSETCCNDIYYYEWKPKTPANPVAEVYDTTIQDRIRMLLPLTLYFHNDEPNPRTTDVTTTKNYQSTLSEYYAMKDTYKSEYARGLTGFEEIKAKRDIEEFFENYVKRGFAQLQLFNKLLLEDLNDGSRVKIMIKGYCSPLTSTEYNVNLAKRRIASLKNYIREIDGGAFLKYLDSTATNGGALTIMEDPIGEATASPFVSDNPNDRRNSIYSRTAAFERKIQIVLYESKAGTKEILFPELFFEATSHDFGEMEQGTKASWVFKFTNTGNTDLVISGVETSCGCTTIDWPHAPIEPGGSGEIRVVMNSEEYMGSKTETATILSNARQSKITLNLSANIIEKR